MLASGELKSKITIHVNHASETAKIAVEKSGGSISIVDKVGAGVSNDDEIRDLAVKWSIQRGNRTGRTGWQFIIQLSSSRNLKLNFNLFSNFLIK